MHRAVILHGMPSKEEYYDPSEDAPSNAHWLPWLQHELLLRNVLAQTPEMPLPFAPNYDQWKDEFERQRVDENTILVGHSCGAGFLVRWLSEADTRVKKVVLVAPWLDPEREIGRFFDFTINSEMDKKVNDGIDVVYSTNDSDDTHKSLHLLRDHLPAARYHEFVNYGHFCLGDMGTREFPELLEICIPQKDNV